MDAVLQIALKIKQGLAFPFYVIILRSCSIKQSFLRTIWVHKRKQRGCKKCYWPLFSPVMKTWPQLFSVPWDRKKTR